MEGPLCKSQFTSHLLINKATFGGDSHQEASCFLHMAVLWLAAQC